MDSSFAGQVPCWRATWATGPGAIARGGCGHGFRADLLVVNLELVQDAGGDPLVLAHQPEQDVLRSYEVVSQGEGLAQ